MNTLPVEKHVQVVNLLVEGMSMRAVTRVADVSINTITTLLIDVGAVCAEYQPRKDLAHAELQARAVR